MQNKHSIYLKHSKRINYQNEAVSLVKSVLRHLNTDDLTRFFANYQLLYGLSSRDKLAEIFNSWLQSKEKLSKTFEKQILSAATIFLSIEQQAQLLQLEALVYFQKIISDLRSKPIEVDYYYLSKKKWAWDNFFLNMNDKINAYTIKDLQWFSLQFFAEEDLKWFIQTAKYVLKKQLVAVYQQVKTDFQNYLPKIKQWKRGWWELHYWVDFIGIEIQINKANLNRIDIEGIFKDYTPTKPKIEGVWKTFLETYILEESIDLAWKQPKIELDNHILALDWQMIDNQYHTLKKNSANAEISAWIKGSGGYFYVSCELKSLRRLWISTFLEISKIGTSLFFSIAFYWFTRGFIEQFAPFIGLLILPVVFLASFLISGFSFKTIESNLKDIGKY